MDTSIPFRDLLTRIRTGDQDAATELVRLYEPEIRRAVRVRLTDPNLRRVVDSTDICQSVFGAFFVRVAAGQFELSEPSHLVRLLVRMAQNKIIDHAKRPPNRDTRTPEDGVMEQTPEDGRTPSSVVALAELLASAKQRMTTAEWELAQQRAAGASWEEIAAAHGTTPDAARHRHSRTVNRVCEEMGLGSDDE